MMIISMVLAIALHSPTVGQAEFVGADHAVYSAVVERLFLSTDVRQVVVRQETEARTADGRAQEELARVLAELPESVFEFDDFRERNARSVEIGPGFDLRIPVSLISNSGLLSFGGGKPAEYWERFRTRYPDAPGYLIFSRPGYSRDGHRALVYVYRGCGPRCSESRYILLRKDVHGWGVVGITAVE